MSVLRLLLAWLIMAAVPLQGFAAASMAFCKDDHHAAAGTQAAAPVPARTAAHDHSSLAHGVETQVDKAAGQSAGAELPDAVHKCGVCASCCYSFGIAELVYWPSFAPVPQAAPPEPFLVILTTPTPVLDKPPRA